MAIANPASRQAGSRPEPHREPDSEPETMTTDTENGPEAAHSGATPEVSSDASLRAGRLAETLPAVEISGGELELDGPAGSFVSPVASDRADEASDVALSGPEDSSASYLPGSSS